MLQDNGKGLVVTSGRSGIPELHISSRARTTQTSKSHTAADRTLENPSKEDNLEAMRTLENAQKDMLQKVPGHLEPVRKADAQGLGGNSGDAAVSKQRPNESYFAYKWRISH